MAGAFEPRIDFRSSSKPVIILVRHPESIGNVLAAEIQETREKIDSYKDTTMTEEDLDTFSDLVLHDNKLRLLALGATDPDLSDRGREQALRTIDYLFNSVMGATDMNKVRIFNSGFRRTVALSSALTDKLVAEGVSFKPRLEVHTSIHQGFAEIPPVEDFDENEVPEPWNWLYDRVRTGKDDYDINIVCTHGNFISSVIKSLNGFEVIVDNCSITALVINSESDFSMIRTASTEHL